MYSCFGKHEKKLQDIGRHRFIIKSITLDCNAAVFGQPSTGRQDGHNTTQYKQTTTDCRHCGTWIVQIIERWNFGVCWSVFHEPCHGLIKHTHNHVVSRIMKYSVSPKYNYFDRKRLTNSLGTLYGIIMWHVRGRWQGNINDTEDLSRKLKIVPGADTVNISLKTFLF